MFNNIEEAVAFAEKKGKSGGRPQFYLQAVDHKEPDGTVVSKDVVFVRIFNISDPKNIIERPKVAEDEKRWPDHWKAYKENTEAPTDGTPIKSFPNLTPADIENLSRQHIRTVEELLEISEPQLQKVLGGRALATRKQATEWLDYRKGKTETQQLLRRIEELEKQLGNDTDDVPKRAEGNGVSESIDTGRKQQSGRKNNTRSRKKSSRKAGGGVSVDSPD